MRPSRSLGPSGTPSFLRLRVRRNGLTHLSPSSSIHGRDSDYRTFKHIYESCLFQRENFCSASQIKLVYLIDAYLTLVETQNPLALYGISRSLLELNAFLHEVRTMLVKAAAHAETTWVEAGEKFFGTLIRARFATIRDDLKTVLRESGVPEDQIKTLHIMDCVRGLSKRSITGMPRRATDGYATLSITTWGAWPRRPRAPLRAKSRFRGPATS